MTKSILISAAAFAYCILQTANCFPQGTAINTSGAAADNSSMLDVSSTSKGFLMPRLSTAERNAIVSPASGLMLINTTSNCIEVFFNSVWQNVYCSCSIPSTPLAITGQDTVCGNSSGNVYTINHVSGADFYNWTVPAGAGITLNSDTAITVTFGSNPSGDITVEAGNSCGISGQRILAISQGYSPGSTTFDFTGSQQTFEVPSCVTSVTIDAYGAQGFDDTYGGKGGRAKGTLSVTAGQTLYVYVGQYGNGSGGGWNGGESSTNGSGCLANYGGQGYGGGASDVRVGGTNLSNRVIVAGGGGARGLYGNGCSGSYLTEGGDGGGDTGEAGTTNSTAGGGGGGSQTTGGAAGTGTFGNGGAGALGNGGDRCPGDFAGGDGGGGYYGGGGGSGSTGCWRGGGGGGSNYLGGVSMIINSQGVKTGDGQVIISW